MRELHDVQPAGNEGSCAGGHDGPGDLCGFEVVEQGAGAGDFGGAGAVVEGDGAFGLADVGPVGEGGG